MTFEDFRNLCGSCQARIIFGTSHPTIMATLAAGGCEAACSNSGRSGTLLQQRDPSLTAIKD
jgi:hypothetical protein